MNELNEIDQQLVCSDWYIKEANKLLAQYSNAKTEHAKNRILPKLEAMLGKLNFQGREIRKYMPDETVETWKNE